MAHLEDDVAQDVICELNLALIPDETLANRLIALSERLATKYRALVQLNGVKPRLVFTPHLTLYQVPIRARDLSSLYAGLVEIVGKT